MMIPVLSLLVLPKLSLNLSSSPYLFSHLPLQLKYVPSSHPRCSLQTVSQSFFLSLYLLALSLELKFIQFEYFLFNFLSHFRCCRAAVFSYLLNTQYTLYISVHTPTAAHSRGKSMKGELFKVHTSHTKYIIILLKYLPKPRKKETLF
uniref:Uncharacterized protein n=1 Tax=Cacopsylla melanoneura TaxID=428564 RepID=A0A8D8VXG8_9HEMI